jgi:hypothetical protein
VKSTIKEKKVLRLRVRDIPKIRVLDILGMSYPPWVRKGESVGFKA